MNEEKRVRFYANALFLYFNRTHSISNRFTDKGKVDIETCVLSLEL